MKVKLHLILAAAVCALSACDKEDVLYKQYQPADTAPKAQENVDWSRSAFYSARDNTLPRVLMIGDSICNGNYSVVKELLKGKFSVGFWASSMGSTDPDFIYALNLTLEQVPADIITYNNGLHRHAPLESVKAANENAVRFIRAKLPNAKVVLVGTTPCRDQPHQSDTQMRDIAKKLGLPFVDLDALMAPLDRKKNWADLYHFRAPAVKIQGKAIADAVEKEALKLDLKNLSRKTFNPAPVVKEDRVFNLIVGMNTKDSVGKRALLLGRDSHSVAWDLRNPLGKAINFSAWETSKCATDADYPRFLDYVLSLLKYDYVFFVQPANIHKSGDAWNSAFKSAIKRISARLPQTKIILCASSSRAPESRAAAAFMKNYAEKNKLDFFEIDIEKGNSKKLLKNILTDYFKDMKNVTVQKNSEMGPNGAVK